MQSKAAFRKLIRELVEETLEEMTTSDAAGPYMTPNAFTGGTARGERKRKKIATQLGYTMVGDLQDEKADVMEGPADESLVVKKKLAEGRYHQWRNDETLKPRQKLGRAIREANEMLKEVERVVDMNVRLKKESGLESSTYWKRTNKALMKIESSLIRVMNKIKEIR